MFEERDTEVDTKCVNCRAMVGVKAAVERAAVLSGADKATLTLSAALPFRKQKEWLRRMNIHASRDSQSRGFFLYS